MNRYIKPAFILLFALLLGPLETGMAAETGAHDGGAHGSGAHGHEFHRNSLFGFIGFTGEDRRERAGALGIEYERRLSERWGLAAGIERAFGDLDFTVFAVPVVLHHGKWGFYAGPGIEKAEGHGSEFLVRVGALYEFEVGNVLLAPKFTVDFVDGDTVLVGGLAIGFGF